MYTYKIEEVVRVIDGDTVDLLIDVGFSIKIKHRFRLDGYDAPETWRPKTSAEREGGEKVKQYLIDLLDKYKDNIFVNSLKLGIYGRYGAIIIVPSDEAELNLNDEIDKYIQENQLTKEILRALP